MKRFDDIRNWADDRNLVKGAKPQAQLIKLMEEVGELGHGMCRGRKDKVIDGIGDVIVVLTILAAQHNILIEYCIESAWEEIKDRKGKMVDGVFVKNDDLKDYHPDHHSV